MVMQIIDFWRPIIIWTWNMRCKLTSIQKMQCIKQMKQLTRNDKNNRIVLSHSQLISLLSSRPTPSLVRVSTKLNFWTGNHQYIVSLFWSALFNPLNLRSLADSVWSKEEKVPLGSDVPPFLWNQSVPATRERVEMAREIVGSYRSFLFVFGKSIDSNKTNNTSIAFIG